MRALQNAIDSAAQFIGPFVDKSRRNSEASLGNTEIAEKALFHSQAINTADLASDIDAPYDASLAGIVYNLFDLIYLLGILPHLSPGVAFPQRPKSYFVSAITVPAKRNDSLFETIVTSFLEVLEQKGTGLQPLLSERCLPDIISALAELSFSPSLSDTTHLKFRFAFQRVTEETPTSRLLPILTTFLQQPLPLWFKPIISNKLAFIPLRPQGIRHIVEFLSLAHMSKSSCNPQHVVTSPSKMPISLEAITQTSRLLILPPRDYSQASWFAALAPQLLRLLDGNEGGDMSRAAAQIIMGGILSKKATGTPGSVGWNLFALPVLEGICPGKEQIATSKNLNEDRVVVSEQCLLTSLRRLSSLVSSYSHASLLSRLTSPLLLPLWGLLNYAKVRPSLDKEWTRLPLRILSRYMEVACDVKQVDAMIRNLAWDGDPSWVFAPGSHGGVEIRRHITDVSDPSNMASILSRISSLDTRITSFVVLLVEAKISDETAGSIFIRSTKRWLFPAQNVGTALLEDNEIDPLSILIDAKMSEALAQNFQTQFARSPQHIIDLMAQLIESFVRERENFADRKTENARFSRAMLGNVVRTPKADSTDAASLADENLVIFALSILSTIVTADDFKQTPENLDRIQACLPYLEVILKQKMKLAISDLVINSASNLIDTIRPAHQSENTTSSVADSLSLYRTALRKALADLLSEEPPNRTWALHQLQKLIQNPDAFPNIDLPSVTHTLLSRSLADPESYVHTAAIPVLVDLARHAPNPVIAMMTDAFTDVDERSLETAKASEGSERDKEIQYALDFRLRIGEALNGIIVEDRLWTSRTNHASSSQHVDQIAEACLSIASRRGQRSKTSSARTKLSEVKRRELEEGEAAWGGPMPNLLEPEDGDGKDQADHDAMLKIVQEWENGGIEEDTRIRASALSILSLILELRVELLKRSAIDTALQTVLLILCLETSESKALLRRASLLVILNLLRGHATAIENGRESVAAMSLRQYEEVHRTVSWIRDQDTDELTKDHALVALEGMEAVRMKQLFELKGGQTDRSMIIDPSQIVKGLSIGSSVGERSTKRQRLVEEVE